MTHLYELQYTVKKYTNKQTLFFFAKFGGRKFGQYMNFNKLDQKAKSPMY